MIILHIISRGRPVKGAFSEISFGQLFYETDNIFEALAGTLKTAKKYGVVDYEGDLLFQGTNDTTMIRLVKDKHEGEACISADLFCSCSAFCMTWFRH